VKSFPANDHLMECLSSPTRAARSSARRNNPGGDPYSAMPAGSQIRIAHAVSAKWWLTDLPGQASTGVWNA